MGSYLGFNDFYKLVVLVRILLFVRVENLNYLYSIKKIVLVYIIESLYVGFILDVFGIRFGFFYF